MQALFDWVIQTVESESLAANGAARHVSIAVLGKDGDRRHFRVCLHSTSNIRCPEHLVECGSANEWAGKRSVSSTSAQELSPQQVLKIAKRVQEVIVNGYGDVSVRVEMMPRRKVQGVARKGTECRLFMTTILTDVLT